jgi:hypothetical protein
MNSTCPDLFPPGAPDSLLKCGNRLSRQHLMVPKHPSGREVETTCCSRRSSDGSGLLAQLRNRIARPCALAETTQPDCKCCMPLQHLVVPYRHSDPFRDPHQHHQLPRAGNRRLQLIPLQHDVVTVEHRHDRGRKLAPLRLVDRDRLRQGQRLQLERLIADDVPIGVHR